MSGSQEGQQPRAPAEQGQESRRSPSRKKSMSRSASGSGSGSTPCVPIILAGIRGTLKREPLLHPLLALLTRDLIQRVYIPKGSPESYPLHKKEEAERVGKEARQQRIFKPKAPSQPNPRQEEKGPCPLGTCLRTVKNTKYSSLLG